MQHGLKNRHRHNPREVNHMVQGFGTWVCEAGFVARENARENDYARCHTYSYKTVHSLKLSGRVVWANEILMSVWYPLLGWSPLYLVAADWRRFGLSAANCVAECLGF